MAIEKDPELDISIIMMRRSIETMHSFPSSSVLTNKIDEMIQSMAGI